MAIENWVADQQFNLEFGGYTSNSNKIYVPIGHGMQKYQWNVRQAIAGTANESTIAQRVKWMRVNEKEMKKERERERERKRKRERERESDRKWHIKITEQKGIELEKKWKEEQMAFLFTIFGISSVNKINFANKNPVYSVLSLAKWNKP